MPNPFSDKDMGAVREALDDAIAYNKILVDSEWISDCSEGQQHPDVRDAMRKIRIFARLSGSIGKRDGDGCS